MTFKEKLEKEYPGLVDDRYTGGCKGCPHGYGYEEEKPCKGINNEECKKCWNREMPNTLEPMTAEEAWELVKRLNAPMKPDEIFEFYNFIDVNGFAEIFQKYTPYEAKAKLDKWESKQIRVGDVVLGNIDEEAIVARTKEEMMYLIFADGSCGKHRKENFKKTGKHIDIQSVLEQIGKEE